MHISACGSPERRNERGRNALRRASGKQVEFLHAE